MKKVLLFLMCTQYMIFINAQENKTYLDSLFKSISEDTVSVQLLDSLCFEKAKSDMDTALLMANKAIEIAQNIGYEKGIADVSKSLGYIYLANNAYDKALIHYKNALEINRRLGRSRIIAMILNNMGMIYKRINSYDVAAQYYIESLKIREDMKDSVAMINAYNGLGALYNRIEKYQQALEYYQKGLDIAEKQKKQFYIGLFYANMALSKYELKQYEQAYELAKKAIPLFGDNEKQPLSNNYITMGYILCQLGDHAKAKQMFTFSEQIAQKEGYKETLLDSYMGIAEVLMVEGNHIKAIEKFKEAEKLAIEHNNLSKQRVIYQRIADIYSRQGFMKDAFLFQKKYIAINDSIFNIESMEKINELNILYEVDKKDRDIAILSKEKELKELKLKKSKIIIIFFTIIIALGFIVLSLLLRAYATKRKTNKLLMVKNAEIEQQKEEILSQRGHLELLNEELTKQKAFIARQRDEIEIELRQTLVKSELLEKEKIKFQYDALKNQVNPHFLFNNFSTLINLISENPQMAEKYVVELSNVYRYILTSSQDNLQDISSELLFINSYLFLANIRHNNLISMNIHIPEGCKDCFIPLLSLQLLVENAIKHNVINHKKPLFINIRKKEDRIEIQNNITQKKQVQNSTGIGLQNIIDRYKLFTDRPVEIVNNEKEFIVRLPLLEMA